jgi:glyoxylase-like metal-dependent hydrolase (beta-lactamase superfamily II)
MELSKDSYNFKIGSIECYVIHDGIFMVPDTQFEKLHNQHPDIHFEQVIDVMCMLIRKQNHTLLIDTGYGVDMLPNAGKLLQILEALEIRPTEINTVFLTHGHPDHIGGNTDNKGKPAFRNARYLISRNEWDFLASQLALPNTEAGENEKQMWMAAVRKNLLSIQDRLEFIDDGTELLPGIKSIEAPGHTPGHTMLDISSGNDRVIYISDLVQLMFQLEYPSWSTPIDVAPIQVETTRTNVLTWVSAANVMVFAPHFSFPGLGHIIQKDVGWFWQPIVI